MSVDSGGRQRRPLLTAHYAAALVVCAVAAFLQYLASAARRGEIPICRVSGGDRDGRVVGSLGPGLVATAAAAIVTDYFFLRPVHSLWISDPVDGAGARAFRARHGGRHHQDARSSQAGQPRSNGQDRHCTRTGTHDQPSGTDRGAVEGGRRTRGHTRRVDGAPPLVRRRGRSGVARRRNEAGYEVAHAIGYADPVRMSPEHSPEARSLVAQAVRGQELIVIESRADSDARFADLAADHLFAAHEAAAVLPLLMASRAIGVVILSFEAPRKFDAGQRRFILSASRQIAQALLRARTFERAEKARAEGEAFRVRAAADLRERQKAEEALRESEAKYRALAARTDRLYALSAGLSEAITLDAVAKVIVRQGKVVVGASTGSVALLVDGGKQFEILYDEDYTRGDASRRFAAEPGSCSTTAATTRTPVYVSSFAEWQRQYPRSATLAADGGYASAAVLPLSADGAVLGVLSFHFTAPVNFVDEYPGAPRIGRAALRAGARSCASLRGDRARAGRRRVREPVEGRVPLHGVARAQDAAQCDARVGGHAAERIARAEPDRSCAGGDLQ